MSERVILGAGRPSAKKSNAKALAQLTDRAMKRVNFDIPEEQHRMLKVYAAKHGKTIKDLLSDYISNLKLEAEQ